ncbi:hypothetical protein FMUND_3239 [Fusarium mundagurra]|uniref:Uncharacterized protein n=1 Tax=Fusarium mundagurra TaxID=1567541 RepID=A0A8H5Z2L2_9HYPO|nr:hypothetical protein FMUND_3239 [Fusarium mundagurra]
MHRGSSQFSSRLKEPIRSGLEISSDILAINTALRRERDHKVDLAKSRKHHAKQRTADPIRYAKRVNADKAAWVQKNPQKVLDIAARARRKDKDSNRFFYKDYNKPFTFQSALDSHLETEKHAKRVAGIPVAPLSTYAQNRKNKRQEAKESGKFRCTTYNKSFGRD